MFLTLLRFVAHVAAAFGVFWALALGAHLLGVSEDPRIVEMAAWERAVMVVWGLAAVEWWWQYRRFRGER